MIICLVYLCFLWYFVKKILYFPCPCVFVFSCKTINGYDYLRCVFVFSVFFCEKSFVFPLSVCFCVLRQNNKWVWLFALCFLCYFVKFSLYFPCPCVFVFWRKTINGYDYLPCDFVFSVFFGEKSFVFPLSLCFCVLMQKNKWVWLFALCFCVFCVILWKKFCISPVLVFLCSIAKK